MADCLLRSELLSEIQLMYSLYKPPSNSFQEIVYAHFILPVAGETTISRKILAKRLFQWFWLLPSDQHIAKQKMSSICQGGENYTCTMEIVKGSCGTYFSVLPWLWPLMFQANPCLLTAEMGCYCGINKRFYLISYGTKHTYTYNLSNHGPSLLMYPDVIDFLSGGISLTYGFLQKDY